MELFIPGPVGRLEARLWLPDEGSPAAACALAHPHPLRGGSMHSTVVFRAGKGLVAAGVAVLRFQFRGVGRSAGEFDGGGGELADLEACLAHLAERFPGIPRWAGGFSFGAVVAAAVAAGTSAGVRPGGAELERLLLLAVPVLAADCSVIERVRVPGLVLQAGQDEFGNLAALEARHPGVYAGLERDEVEGASHFFGGLERELERRVRRSAEGWLTARPEG